MTHTILYSFILIAISVTTYGQKTTNVVDTWSNVPPASDDRFTNPKSKLYAGPNGWYNYGELRATVANTPKTTYGYKGGFDVIQGMLTATTSSKLYVLAFDFGTEKPAVGTYQVAAEGNPGQKKVHVSFSDVSGQKIKEWSSESGMVQVSQVNGFLYVKCRNVSLQPNGVYNTGDFKAPMTLGFEGAIAPE
ncbi:hypothetical protein GCM10028807_31330 [Spirosoma daeguense]